ncbi:MAG: serine/threonine-protein phosphatase [Spirochaetaceae bacterium]|jgi:sigma-B regulation protein RsbU (phosphoserine phosphatase)|nr:serine/threonine-protein phosphatase [Spirochaetaceae bacterium]
MPQSAQDIGRVFSPLQIGYITDVTEPVNASVNVDWVLETIASRPDLEVIPVERNGTVLGVLPKDVVEKLAASAWSKFWQRDLDEYIIHTEDVLDASAYINRVIDSALTSKKSELSWFIVHHRRSYLGVISLKKMLEYTTVLRNQDLLRAGEIQRFLLEKSMINDKRVSVFLYNHMAHEIGGDFYRIYRADKDRFVVGCFDVAGKNISGALTTMALGTCFASFELFEFVGTAEKITQRINTLVKSVNPPGVFVAAVLFYIDFTVKQVRIHNCGFSPVLIFVPRPDNKISYKISTPSLPPLGIEDEYDLSDTLLLPISRGLRLCAYSDGLTDMMNIYGERFGEEQATRLIKELHSMPPEASAKLIGSEIKSWIGTASLADDVTVADIRFN